ncbi:winged helix DNA-binding domain-containing protein [Streptomyces sp. NPDC001373]|uniref:winged helix DNA-binding domain-containing protein n=1 Tax=Streptomyces sp. NPDC001373 TaxID=3364565 RepID=UPI0036D1ED75
MTVVRRVFAIQAQDATAADLGIRVRGRDITAQAIRTAYEKERSIVRNWYMRGTLHTIPSDDARWVLQLLSPRILAATSRRYQQLGLGDDLRRRADHLIRRALAAHGPLTRAELTERLTALGIPPDGQAPFYLIRHAALTGILCHGPQRAGEGTYVLLDDWLPSTGRFRWEGDDALAELARRYLAAHSPATLEDFAAWSGLPITWARRAWKVLAESGVITEYGALTMLAGRVKELPRSSDTPDVRMLPAYDNYLIGYRTREASAPLSTRLLVGAPPLPSPQHRRPCLCCSPVCRCARLGPRASLAHALKRTPGGAERVWTRLGRVSGSVHGEEQVPTAVREAPGPSAPGRCS